MRSLLLTLFLSLSLLPAKAQVADNKPHRATLTWNAPAAGATKAHVVGYNVYRAEKEGGEYRLVAKKVTALTYTDTNVKPKHTYYYKVTSVDARGQESIASTAKATIP
ncbi:MAG: fibronectin type III domain-containing protein [Terriglobales bacterium]